jgi:hypothetical protein
MSSVLIAAAACSQQNWAEGPDPAREQIAEVTLALAETPPNVRCISVTASTSVATTRSFDVMAGGPTIWRWSLPVGVVVFTATAHNEACPAVTADSVASWLGGPLSVTLVPGLNMVTLQMRPVGTANVVVDFDPNATPMCAPTGWACTSSAQCCGGNTCTMGAADLPAGVGRCQVPAPPPGPAVTIPLRANVNYLMYPLDGAADCRPGSGPPFIMSLGRMERACLPEALGDVVAMRITGLERCTTTADGRGSCAPCADGDASCRPATCFPAAEKLPVDDDCPSNRTIFSPTVSTLLIIPRAAAGTMDPPGLPRVVVGTEDGVPFVVTPPPTQQGLVWGTLEGPVARGDNVGGESCGSSNLCGLVDFTSTSYFRGWSFFGGQTATIFRF